MKMFLVLAAAVALTACYEDEARETGLKCLREGGTKIECLNYCTAVWTSGRAGAEICADTVMGSGQ